ncbi:MAG: pyridoxal 5'-phosphate synthase glutaminase subunit PdxT [Candidatus Limnocylindrus sp.]
MAGASRRTSAPVIGVMAVQGDFREHLDTLAAIGAKGREVRLPADLEGVSGLILPGGESTAMRKLYERWNLVAPIKALAARGAPILGTCAGAILLATRISDGDAPVLSLIDMEVRRNAFGRQLESFETSLTMQSLKPGGGSTPLRAVFIRAPEIVRVGPAASVVAQLPDGRTVAARQGNIVGISFHPEIAGETRLHRWLVDQAAQHARRD